MSSSVILRLAVEASEPDGFAEACFEMGAVAVPAELLLSLIHILFYNTQRHCYVVVEIKTGKFDSSYAGQLGTYVVAVNHQMQTEADNPTLGLLICKDMDQVCLLYTSTIQLLGCCMVYIFL